VIHAIGYLGSAGAAVMWMPQAWRAIRNRRDVALLNGISPLAYLTALVFNALLLTYGLVNDAGPVAVAGAINLVCAFVIVVVIARARGAAT